MKQVLFEGLDDEQRIQALQDNCDAVTIQSFLKRSTSAEKQILRKRNAELDIQLGLIAEEEKAMKEEIKDKRTPILKEKKDLLETLKSGGRYVEGKVYKFIDREAKEVCFYDENGFLVDHRRMTKEDSQLNIKYGQTGTND